MTEQKITIQRGNDPFDTEEITVMVPSGVKLLSNEPYAEEALKMYGIDLNERQIINSEDVQLTQGTVYSVNDETALINVGEKWTAICYLSKEPTGIVEQLKPGVLVDVKIRKKEGEVVTASISDAIQEVKRREIYESIGDKSVGFNGVVKELIHGGYWVDIGGVQCFMPGSLGGINKLPDFEEILGKELVVMPITYADDKNTIVVSHREYLKTLIPSTIESLKENMGEKITGRVTGTTKFGVFAEFNQCLTGLIPIAELDDSLESFNNRNIKPGDSITFWVKDIINNNKIILSQLGAVKNPWDGAGQKYSPMTVTEGKVIKKTGYGVFVELEKGVSGLLHKSEFNDQEFSRGDVFDVLVRSINPADKKITLGLPE